MSYTNFYRAIQKEINLKFLASVEAKRANDDIWSKNDIALFRKNKLFDQVPLFDYDEVDETNKIFETDSEKVVGHADRGSDPQNFYRNLKKKNGEAFNDCSDNYKVIPNKIYGPYLNSNPTNMTNAGSAIPKECFGKNLTKENYDPNDPDNLDSPIHDDNQKDPAFFTRKQIHPQNMFIPEKYQFEDISQNILEQNPKSVENQSESDRQDYIRLTDSNNNSIFYDCSIYDFFENLKKLSLIISFYIESNFLEYGSCDAPATDPENVTKEENRGNPAFDGKNKKLNTDRHSINYIMDKLNRNFNYEYFLTEILEKEQFFNFRKAKIVKLLMEICNNITDGDLLIKFYDFIVNFMGRKVGIDLLSYKAMNENIIEQIKKLNQPEMGKLTAEIQNFMLTIVDNYNNEILYLERYEGFLRRVYEYQKNLSTKVQVINNTVKHFDLDNLLGNKHVLKISEQWYANMAKMLDLVTKIDEINDFTLSTYEKSQEFDKSTYSEYLFEVYYKNHVRFCMGQVKDINAESNFFNF